MRCCHSPFRMPLYPLRTLTALNAGEQVQRLQHPCVTVKNVKLKTNLLRHPAVPFLGNGRPKPRLTQALHASGESSFAHDLPRSGADLSVLPQGGRRGTSAPDGGWVLGGAPGRGRAPRLEAHRPGRRGLATRQGCGGDSGLFSR